MKLESIRDWPTKLEPGISPKDTHNLRKLWVFGSTLQSVSWRHCTGALRGALVFQRKSLFSLNASNDVFNQFQKSCINNWIFDPNILRQFSLKRKIQESRTTAVFGVVCVGSIGYLSLWTFSCSTSEPATGKKTENQPILGWNYKYMIFSKQRFRQKIDIKPSSIQFPPKKGVLENEKPKRLSTASLLLRLGRLNAPLRTAGRVVETLTPPFRGASAVGRFGRNHQRKQLLRGGAKCQEMAFWRGKSWFRSSKEEFFESPGTSFFF